MIKNLTPLLLILTIVQCSGGVTDTCSVINYSMHQVNHPSVTDLTKLDTSLHRVPGEYATTVKIGVNGTPVTVVADTGSSRLLVSTNDYKPTGQPIGAPETDGYGSCQAVATDYTELVGLTCGDPIAQTIASTSSAGCPNILGLAYSQDGLANHRTFFGDLVAGKPQEFVDMFSMVLCATDNGSQIVLGGSVPNAPTTISYTPIVTKSYYVVKAQSMNIGGQSLGTFSANAQLGNGGTTIIDTGTTLAILPPAIYTAIVAAIQKIRPDLPAGFFSSTLPSDANYTLSSSELGDISKLPTIQVVFDGATLNVAPTTYMKTLDSDNIIFGFRPTVGSEFPILGQAVLDYSYIVFDRANSQVGFAAAGNLCST